MIDQFKNKHYLSSHLHGHLDFLETLNDANPESFKILNMLYITMSSKGIDNNKLITPKSGHI